MLAASKDFGMLGPELEHEKQADWQNLLSRAKRSRQYLEYIKSRPAAPKENKQDEFVTEELIINTLRSSQRPEVVYCLLRCYAEAHSDAPIIYTDKGKALYIQYDRQDDNLSLYIGESNEIVCVSEQEGHKIFLMDVQEKYDFLLYSSLGVVLKRRFSAAGIIELAKKENENENDLSDHPEILTLVFSTGQESECALRTDWMFSIDNYNNSTVKHLAASQLACELPSNNVLFAFNLFGNRKQTKTSGLEAAI